MGLKAKSKFKNCKIISMKGLGLVNSFILKLEGFKFLVFETAMSMTSSLPSCPSDFLVTAKSQQKYE